MKRAGTIYLTIRRKMVGGYCGDAFTIVRATTRPHQPARGEVEIPIKIEIDDAWFVSRLPLAKVEIQDLPEMAVQAQEAAR